MFKYVWLIILGMLYFGWFFRVIKNIKFCISYHCLNELDSDSIVFIMLHLMMIFMSSLAAFCV